MPIPLRAAPLTPQPAAAQLPLFAMPDYRRLWAIGGLTGIARWLEFLALSVFAYEVTRSAPLVALLAIMRMLPYVLFGIATGALADMFDRRRLLLAGLGLVLVTSLMMTGLAWAGIGRLLVRRRRDAGLGILLGHGHAGPPALARRSGWAGARAVGARL